MAGADYPSCYNVNYEDVTPMVGHYPSCYNVNYEDVTPMVGHSGMVSAGVAVGAAAVLCR
jgi:hypothetical protein